MKNDHQRRSAGTVPRKLELVNDYRVVVTIASGKRMTVSQNPAAAPTILPACGSPAFPAPFWELEALIESGVDRDQALEAMAIRRGEKPSMPEAGVPAQRDEHLLLES